MYQDQWQTEHAILQSLTNQSSHFIRQNNNMFISKFITGKRHNATCIASTMASVQKMSPVSRSTDNEVGSTTPVLTSTVRLLPSRKALSIFAVWVCRLPVVKYRNLEHERRISWTLVYLRLIEDNFKLKMILCIILTYLGTQAKHALTSSVILLVKYRYSSWVVVLVVDKNCKWNVMGWHGMKEI